ncbi:hypothetical protein [Nostoc sp. TCL26-01]|uniref:hypothetical protein n=1 Tax=Nostoc sp. TCL26-01 TaxID=2576904 RepID=UPI0015B9235F|nr:hypothetical protein [Nostoc sp. TCL26-01]
MVEVTFTYQESIALLSFLENKFHSTEENKKVLNCVIQRIIMEVDNYEQLIKMLPDE